MDDGLISLSGVWFAYEPGRPVLQGLDFTLRNGERAGLIGPNGSGKTTLLHLIMGLIRPSAGRVSIMGKERRTEADFREVRAGLGFVFQDPDDQLFCPTVAEDVAFGPLNLGLTHAQAHEATHRALEAVGLAGFEGRLTYKLSAGEKKLVSLATVLAMSPKVLLLDEPTAGLDDKAAGRLAAILSSSGLPYLVISHDHDFLARTTNHVYRLEQGRISAND
ncbi:MAG: ABC transporter ATP-binding protein [Thermodesulfobacteriota bacterium]